MSRAATPTPSRTRCAIYTRKSSEEGLEQEFNSLDAQREACAAYVKSQVGEGWSLLPTIYDDGGFSGGNIQRPALQRLLADIAAGRVDVVVVYKVDRLTRSLSDFARIVDTFDQADASFVSVTQAFNTTSSMGRLTLNMLLSFAQFEREVTGERIRDKIAASKRKGLWMGGNIALGYEPNGRTLSVNEAEARTVRRVFDRYLALGSVEALRVELERDGVLAKCWTSKKGSRRGGGPLTRGALFYLLSNRLYVGEIVHKGERYPGLHKAIVDTVTFERVQAKLLEHAGDKRRVAAGTAPIIPSSPLTGLVRDDRGNRMTPVAARRAQGRTHRYYVSSLAQLGRRAEAGSLPRVPAAALEQLLQHRGTALQLVDANDLTPWPALREAISSVEVGRRRTSVTFRPDAFTSRGLDASTIGLGLPVGDTVRVDGDVVTLEICALLQRRGGRKSITRTDGQLAVEEKRTDAVLVKSLIRAEAWKRALITGEVPTIQTVAAQEGVQAAYAARVLRLAFLKPALKRAILDGRQPSTLTLQRVMDRGLPILWRDQAPHLH